MPRRTLVAFWTSVVAAVFLLGGGFSSLRRLASGGDPGEVVLVGFSLIGLLAALFVAGRIVLVAARMQRRARKP